MFFIYICNEYTKIVCFMSRATSFDEQNTQIHIK